MLARYIREILRFNPNCQNTEVVKRTIEWLKQLNCSDEFWDLLWPVLMNLVIDLRRELVRQAEHGVRFSPAAWAMTFSEDQNRYAKPLEGIDDEDVATPASEDYRETAALVVNPLQDRHFWLTRGFFTGRGYVLWGEATIEDHERRIAYLEKIRDGINRTIRMHEEAIDLLRKHRVDCLNDLGRVVP